MTGILSMMCAADGGAESDALAGFGWLEGSWVRETKRGVVHEVWTPLGEGGLRGEATITPAGGGDPVVTESLLLVEMAGEVYYVAKPRENEYPVAFRLVSHEGGVAIFENTTHDFPQRISYAPGERGKLDVSIEGPSETGETRRVEFPFRREE